MTLLRNLSAVGAGVAGAAATIFAIETVGHGHESAEGPFFFAVLGYFAGALAGSLIALRIAGARTAWLVPAVLAVLAAINLFAFPHPWWFAPSALLALALGWFVAGRLARRGPARGGRRADG